MTQPSDGAASADGARIARLQSALTIAAPFVIRYDGLRFPLSFLLRRADGRVRLTLCRSTGESRDLTQQASIDLQH